MLRTASLAYFFISTAVAAPNQLTPDEKQAGWLLLFDGSSMNGCVDPRAKMPPGDAWAVEDGCLKALAKPRITEDLFTARAFRDFELRWEWRIAPGGNSGLKYRIQDHVYVQPEEPGRQEAFEARMQRTLDHPVGERPDHGQDYVIGFEYQMIDGTIAAAVKPEQKSGALYDMVAPSTSAEKPPGEWNESHIVLRDNHVEHWLNGTKVVDANLDSTEALAGARQRWATAPGVLHLLADQPKKDCPISLQNHGADTWFRSIKMRPL